MKKKKRKLNNNKIIYIIFFVFFLTIFFLSPISGDDWSNYLEGSIGFSHMIGQAIGMYFSWEGRLVSRLLINILTYNKWLWNIINTIVIIGIVYYINKIVKFKNKSSMIVLTFLLILFMNVFTFSQVITWIAGNITYLFVIPLLLMYMYIIYYDKDTSLKMTILLIFLNIIIPMFIEHMAIILIVLNIYFIIKDYYINKRINKKLLAYLIISIISFMTMYFSPGNRIRSGMENLEFNKLSLIGKIIYNIPNLILYTYRINYFLIPLLILGNYYIIKKCIKNKLLRISLYILEIISLVPTILYLLESFGIITTNINQNNILIIIYYFVLTIINFILLIKYYQKKKKELPIIFYVGGILSNLIMLMSPTWGYRTSFSTYLFLSICYLIIIDENIKINNLKNIVINLMAVTGIIFYLIFYISINKAYQDNKKIITEANNNKSNRIELIAYPGFAPCNINPTDEYHLKKFKEYYKIADDVEIIIVNKNWRYIIFYKK